MGVVVCRQSVVVAEAEDDLIKRLNEWKDNVKNRGIRVNINKTEGMISAQWQKVEDGHVVTVV